MSKLSDSAHALYITIQTALNETGKAPTIKELSRKENLSTRKTLEVLRELEDSLVIKRSPYRSRSIELISPFNESTGKVHDPQFDVPILGTAPGGPFLFADQNIEDTLSVPARLIRGQQNVFLLRVIGNSMSPYLEEGDLALVKQQTSPNEGDYVVAVTEGVDGYEATIKEFHSLDHQIILNPLNRKDAKPIIGSRDKIKVQGVVIGAIKMFYDKPVETTNPQNLDA